MVDFPFLLFLTDYGVEDRCFTGSQRLVFGRYDADEGVTLLRSVEGYRWMAEAICHKELSQGLRTSRARANAKVILNSYIADLHTKD